MQKTLGNYAFLVFKPIIRFDGDQVKGNVDAELVLQAMIDFSNYQQAVLVTGDGDFGCLVKYLFRQNKLQRLIVPNKFRYSKLLRYALPAPGLFTFINDLKRLLEYKGNKNSAWLGGAGGST
ncbi:MAG: NYN domain-containing protein [Candidatus Magasanikbacteria bacterium]|nr:NYN domain-containing protein [Candidatus Magasanikbacteria bacterium]